MLLKAPTSNKPPAHTTIASPFLHFIHTSKPHLHSLHFLKQAPNELTKKTTRSPLLPPKARCYQ
uniref:Putative ovule protein n=1 Tax=Solanum chacoense TaxID=4108 RepID=A0A0V0GFA4_SOLCH